MIRFSEIEKICGANYKLFTFQGTNELEEQVYLNNPERNEPAIGEHYRRLFRTRILPDLVRRIERCPGESCDGPAAMPATPAPPIEREHAVARIFRDLLELCGCCGDTRPRCLVIYEGMRTLPGPDPYFACEVDLAHDDLRCALDPVDLFPDPTDTKTRLARLEQAIACCYQIHAAQDASWLVRPPSKVRATDDFWRSLVRADFRGEERLYRIRILYALVQITCGRDETINEHRMAGQTVRDGTKSHGKWNAYVFKMGATPLDRRCSRLYYAKVEDGILLDEFEPDAHP